MLRGCIILFLILNFNGVAKATLLPHFGKEVALPTPEELKFNSLLEEVGVIPVPQVSQPIPNPLAPLWKNHSRNPANDPNILIITDQDSEEAANNVKNLFEKKLAPFNCMNLKVEIVKISEAELGCHPYVSGNTRLLYCTTKDANGNIVQSDSDGGPGRNKAEELKNSHHAEVAIMVMDLPEWGGSGYRNIPMITTKIWTEAAAHELLHSMGFIDEYQEGQPLAIIEEGHWGSIMYSLNGYIPTHWWASIASYFGTTTPEPAAGFVNLENWQTSTSPPECKTQ